MYSVTLRDIHVYMYVYICVANFFLMFLLQVDRLLTGFQRHLQIELKTYQLDKPALLA